MKEYEKELYEYYEEDISKITEGINLIREGTQHIIAALKRMNSGWISVDRNLPHSNWKEIEVTTNEGERKIATYIQKRNIWIDTDYNKIEVVAWKRPSYPYRISTENSKKFKKIEYTDLATYPESFLKKAIKFSAKVEDTYWFTSEEEDFNSEYCTYYSLALENEITDKRSSPCPGRASPKGAAGAI